MLALSSLSLLALSLSLSLSRSFSLPLSHPQHHAPTELLNRIRKTNPQILSHSHSHSHSLSDSDDAMSPSMKRRLQAQRQRVSGTGLRVTPTAYGGDPTGRKDSWAALNTCLEVCLNQSALSPNGFFPGMDTTPSFGPIRDMGGCDIDLGGGEFLISKPLVLPQMNANMQFGRGSLVAAPDFDGDFLFVVGEPGRNCSVPQGSCNIDINFPELFLDGARVASGMQINHVMGVTIGPGGYFLNFTEYGLQINDGHEVMMDRCWLGETNFDFDHVDRGVAPNATAIQINGNDHYILNSIIFSSRIGVEVNGAADYVSGVHVWFPDNNACVFANSAAFHVTGNGNRFNGCYIDGGRAIFTGVSRNIWTNGFECCQSGAAASGTTSSGITLVGRTVGPGLQITNNEFGGGSLFHVDELWPTFYSKNLAFDEAVSSGRDCKATFNISVANEDCERLTEGSAKTLDACAMECCNNPTCTAYQFCDAGGKCEGVSGDDAECWLGQYKQCSGQPRKGWQGMATGSAPVDVVTGVRIEHNSFSGHPAGTRASQSLTQKNATEWVFDFSDVLLFQNIAIVRTHVVAESGFPRAVARPPVGAKVTIETDVPMTGTITVDVDSSALDDGLV